MTPDCPGAWRDVLVAIDVGTSGARAAAFDLDGHRWLEVRRPYPTASPHPGWAEQDARGWRSAALGALGELARRLGTRRRIHAIGLTGQCPSVVVLDRHGRPTGPGLIYRDNRSVAQASMLIDRFGGPWFHRRTGHLPSAFHILPKLLWLRENDPSVWNQATHAVQPRDWVGLALTGEMATDGTHAAATLAYDLRAGAWDRDVIGSLGLPGDLFPPVVSSTAVLGPLRSAVADRIGLPTTTPVVVGGADSQACALGAGVVAPGPVSEMAGSSTCLNAVVVEPLDVPEITHYPHVVGSAYTTETGINTTGAAVAWLADLVYGGRAGRARSADYEGLDQEIASVPPGADGILAVPALADGERTDASLRAAFTGLSLRHGRASLGRAVLEGVAYAIRTQLELLAAGGAPPTELRISGGDTRLGTWNRIKADVTGLPVRTVAGDAAVTGVAMLAGIGVGVYGSVDDAISRCVRPDPPIAPDPGTRDAYDRAFAAYRELIASSIVHRSDA
jgi:xylulokinase